MRGCAPRRGGRRLPRVGGEAGGGVRAAPVETASLAEVAAIWEEAWARARRLWELHFMTNAGSYQSLDDLADLYESLVPGARPDEGLRLVQGLPNDLHSVQRDLYRLGEQAPASPGGPGRDL